MVTAGGEGLDGDIHEASNQGAVFTTMARQYYVYAQEC